MISLLNQRIEPAAREAGAGFAGSQRSDRQRLHKTRLQFNAPSLGANLNPFAGAVQFVAVLFGAFILFAATGAGAMDRYEALAQVEGCSDTIRGRSGECSRFQILPQVWREYTTLPVSAATNPFTARNVAVAIMRDRVAAFVRVHGRVPTDAEWYGIWSRPARSTHLRPVEAERAQRFANLCTR